MASNSRTRWVVLAILSLGLLMVVLDNSVLYTALPALTDDLEATSSEALWIINAYPLVMAGLLLGAGGLGDKFGHKRLFVWGMAIFGVASVIAAYSPTPAVLIAARALLAVGAAMVMPATLALIRQTFTDARERNIAISIWGSVSLVGAALGPVTAGLLLEHFWWGSVFLINIPIAVFAVVTAARLVPRSEAKPDTPWDGVSSLLALVGLAALVFVIKEVAGADRRWVVLIVGFVAAAVALSLFARRQRRLTHPLLDFAVFRSRPVSAGIIAAGVAMFAIAGMQLVTTQRFQLGDGFTPLEAGLLVTCLAGGALPSGLLAGFVMHRIGVTPLIVGGLITGSIGVVGALVALPLGVVAFGAGLAVMGFGLGAVMAAASSAVMGNIAPERAGMGSSLEEVSYEFGSLTAVAVLGSIFSGLAAAGDINGGFNAATMITSAILVLGVVSTGLLLRGVKVKQGH